MSLDSHAVTIEGALISILEGIHIELIDLSEKAGKIANELYMLRTTGRPPV